MAKINEIGFKGYFINKGNIKSYRLLTVVENDLERTFLNLLAQEKLNTILVFDKSNIFIKNFDSVTALCDFYDKNYNLLADRSFIKANRLTLSVLGLVDTKKDAEAMLEKTYVNVKTEK